MLHTRGFLVGGGGCKLVGVGSDVSFLFGRLDVCTMPQIVVV